MCAQCRAWCSSRPRDKTSLACFDIGLIFWFNGHVECLTVIRSWRCTEHENGEGEVQQRHQRRVTNCQPCSCETSVHQPRPPVTMQAGMLNDEGTNVDLYIPRKWCVDPPIEPPNPARPRDSSVLCAWCRHRCRAKPFTAASSALGVRAPRACSTTCPRAVVCNAVCVAEPVCVPCCWREWPPLTLLRTLPRRGHLVVRPRLRYRAPLVCPAALTRAA